MLMANAREHKNLRHNGGGFCNYSVASKRKETTKITKKRENNFYGTFKFLRISRVS